MALTDRQNIAITLGIARVPKTFAHTPADGKPVAPDEPHPFTAEPASDLLTSSGHGLIAGDPVRFATAGALPAGLLTATTYYVIASGLTGDTFKVSLTVGGSTVNVTDAGTGAHTWRHYLTDEEQAEFDTFKAFVTNGSGPLPPASVLRGSSAMETRFVAYHKSAAYLTWWHDNEESREAQYRLRKAEILVGNTAAVPISADVDGDGDAPPVSPIPHGDPP